MKPMSLPGTTTPGVRIGTVVAIEQTREDDPNSGVYQVDTVKRKVKTPRKLQAFVFGEDCSLTPTEQEPTVFLKLTGGYRLG